MEKVVSTTWRKYYILLGESIIYYLEKVVSIPVESIIYYLEESIIYYLEKVVFTTWRK